MYILGWAQKWFAPSTLHVFRKNQMLRCNIHHLISIHVLSNAWCVRYTQHTENLMLRDKTHHPVYYTNELFFIIYLLESTYNKRREDKRRRYYENTNAGDLISHFHIFAPHSYQNFRCQTWSNRRGVAFTGTFNVINLIAKVLSVLLSVCQCRWFRIFHKNKVVSRWT